MDNSLSKALIMVGSVLLAMIVMAFAAHAFMKIGGWATTQDDEVLIAQKEEFNREYEVYDKNLMYGVDVISCLNKALSNNDKIKKKEVINGNLYDESYEVTVKVTLTKKKPNSTQIKPLEESITVYHMQNGKETAYVSDDGPDEVKITDVGFEGLKSGSSYKSFTNFQDTNCLKSLSQECKKTETEFELNKECDKNSTIIQLLSVSNTISETVKNKDKTSSSKENSWTKAEFKSALYDLKTRRFRCTSLTYSGIGRVNYIEFEEI